MNKSFSWASVLFALLALNLVLNVFFTYRFVKLTRMARTAAASAASYQQTMAKINQNRLVVGRMAAEALQYSRNHPELNRILGPYLPLYKDLNFTIHQTATNALPAPNPALPR